MQLLVTATSMRDIDSATVRQFQIPEILLMEHAAMAMAGALVSRFGRALPKSRGLILAGHGNNGADAVATARILWNNGHKALTLVIDPVQKPSPLFGVQLAMAKKLGIPVLEALSEAALDSADWVLDGIFGIGLARAPEGTYAEWIQALSRPGKPRYVLAVDVPSGVDATFGRLPGVAVIANRTVTFGFYKTGLVTGEALNHVGALSLAAIQIPRELASERADAVLLEAPDVRALLPHRDRNSHKGSFGKVAVAGSDATMLGACALTCRAALRAGAGLVEVHLSEAAADRALFPAEAILKTGEVALDADGTFVLAIGPGLGLTSHARGLFGRVPSHGGALVVDADGLNLLSEMEPSQWTRKRGDKPTILTPHPKEAARLLETTVEAVQSDRIGAARTLAGKWQSTVILKGAGTIIADRDGQIAVTTTGDNGLAKGGTGDVLTGICAAFLAQGLTPFHAAAVAAFLHGKSSEILSQRFGHTYSTLASEVADTIADAIRDL